jgi:hypothetical protein
MEKSSQIAWKIVPLRHFFPLKVVPLVEVFLNKEQNKTSILELDTCRPANERGSLKYHTFKL